MEKNEWSSKSYLVDGFPRSFDNVDGWNEVMGSITNLESVVWFDADEETLTKRIIERS